LTFDFLALTRETSWTFGILLLLTAGGLGPALLFGRFVRFFLLLAPFAGLLMRAHASRPEAHAPAGIVTWPRADPAVPYESLPELLLGNEARTAAFAFVAEIGTLRRLPSTFAYDPACSVALAAAVLGVAAVFAGSWPAVALLVIGLSVSHWYDYMRAGFLAKSLAYPSLLIVAGLFLKTRGNRDSHILALLCVLGAASGLWLTGLLTAAGLFILCTPAELIAYRSDRRVRWEELSRLGICAFVAIAASGYFQHPVASWDRSIFPSVMVSSRSLDLDGWTAITGFSDLTLNAMIVASLASGFILTRAAIQSGEPGPAGLLVAPLVLYPLLLVLHMRQELMQTTGLLYPAMMCGAAWLVSEPRYPEKTPFILVAACILVAIGLRVPRSLTAVARYTGDVALLSSYSEDELDALATAIGHRTALIATENGQESVLMSVELGRRGLSLQWTAQSWYWAIASWRDNWPVPRYSTRPDVIVISALRVGTREPISVGPHFAVVAAESAQPEELTADPAPGASHQQLSTGRTGQ
jgi:hypothetical protein